MKFLFLITIFCLSLSGSATGHDETYERRDAIYPFKQQVYDLCSGHGLMHLNDEEMRDLCGRLANNLVDVRSLLEDPRHDIFLSNLTGLIIRSPIPQKVKRELLRESYQMSKEKSSEGDEWHFTVMRLIEEADVLSLEEIASHVNSQDIRLKGTATRFLEKNSGKESERPELRPDESEFDNVTPDSETENSGDESTGEIRQTGVLRYLFVSVFSIGLLCLGFIIWRKKSSD